MTEKRREVKVVQVNFQCENCKSGEVYPEDDFKDINGKMKHKCNKCNCEVYLDKEYPYFEYYPIRLF